MSIITTDQLIEKYHLQKHPEGGYFTETYRSTVTHDFSMGKRNISTAIYFLLPHGHKSHLHRIQSDELWHFYLGSPLIVVEITPKGELIETILGHDILQGQQVQYNVKAGHWFGSYPLTKKSEEFSFVGCSVAPGFDYQDFELARAETLANQFPQHREVIESLSLP